MSRKGHINISSTLRPAEVTLVDEVVIELKRLRTSGKAPGILRPLHRSSVIRAAVRYALEHQAEFIEWSRHAQNDAL